MDRAADSLFSAQDIRDIALTAGQEVTYTAVPPGSGNRLGVDRDEDTILDNDDNCPLTASANQLDTDNDGAGDICDLDDDNDGLSDTFEQSIGTNTLLADTDGDNISDFDEVNFDGNADAYTPGSDTDPLSVDTDNDGFNDDVEINAGSNPLDSSSVPADGDINHDGSVDVLDVLLATQILQGLKTPTADELLHGDVAPLTNAIPDPDGKIDVADLLLIQRKALGLVSF